MKLSELKSNEWGIISKILGRGSFRKRIIEMGFVKGKKVTVIKNAPLKDPIEYSIMGYKVSLRRSEAAMIEVMTEQDQVQNTSSEFATFTEETIRLKAREKSNTINVALVGNPNCGKTSLFNFASGTNEHVGNYSGVTIEAKTASFEQDGYTINITDLPGTYSLSAYTPEELFVRDFIHEQVPDIIINVVDASNLERNLFLTSQLIDMDRRVIVALNMYDELLARRDRLDYPLLGKMLGIPFVPTVGTRGRGLKELFSKVISVYKEQDQVSKHIHINYGESVEEAIKNIQQGIRNDQNFFITDKYSSRYLALKLIEKDQHVLDLLRPCKNFKEIKDTAGNVKTRMEYEYDDDTQSIIADARYGFIAGALKYTYREGTVKRRKSTEILDSFFTHKLFGYPIFLFFLWLMFQATFFLGNYPMEWIDHGILVLSDLINNIMPTGPLKDLIVDGILGGVGGVIVFLPNILILFFFISLMEDTGYMARTAFLMDKLMHKIGLHGKSFIPLIMGFGCNVPAIMATRTIENRKNRLLTMLINPFMSCSARLPVYILLIGAFFPGNQGSMLFLIYALGILLAILVALVFNKLIFKSMDEEFVMELPPYRVPSLRATTRHMWSKGIEYLKKIAGVILVASILIWALGYFPRNVEYSQPYEQKIDSLKSEMQLNHSKLSKKKTQALNATIDSLKLRMNAERQMNSYIGRIGEYLYPVFKPLGFDWRMGISLLTGVAAKEIVISTMGVLFQVDTEIGESSETLIHKLRTAEYMRGPNEGQPVFTPLVAFAYLVFVLIYFPCIGVIATIKRESGSWKWALFTMFYTTGLAWLASFLIYNVGSLIA